MTIRQQAKTFISYYGLEGAKRVLQALKTPGNRSVTEIMDSFPRKTHRDIVSLPPLDVLKVQTKRA